MSTERAGKPSQEPRTEEREQSQRTVAPPLEREHETQEGVMEEEEERNRQRDTSRRDPDRT